MAKRIFLNIIVFTMFCIIPMYVFFPNQDEYNNIYFRQNIAFLAVFVGSFLLTYLNKKYRIKDSNHKWLWIFFEIIGVLGLVYSGLILAMMFLLQDCCGF